MEPGSRDCQPRLARWCGVLSVVLRCGPSLLRLPPVLDEPGLDEALPSWLPMPSPLMDAPPPLSRPLSTLTWLESSWPSALAATATPLLPSTKAQPINHCLAHITANPLICLRGF